MLNFNRCSNFKSKSSSQTIQKVLPELFDSLDEGTMIHQMSGNTHAVTWCHSPEGPNFTNTTVRNSNLHMGLPRSVTPRLLSSSWALWRQNVIMKYKAQYCSIQIAKCDLGQTNCRSTTCSFTVYQHVLAKYKGWIQSSGNTAVTWRMCVGWHYCHLYLIAEVQLK